MTNLNERIKDLEEELNSVTQSQVNINANIDYLKKEISALKAILNQSAEPQTEDAAPSLESPKEEIQYKIPQEEITISQPTTEFIKEEVTEDETSSPIYEKPDRKSSLEKFIGENLLNKIGIAITVIGVAIGTKYSIEHNLISPTLRIILGYLMGIALIGVGMRLRKKYENYSAVLVGGAMATLYFVTFSAYSFYQLLPQLLAFALMLVFTIFTVIASLSYNKQIIAHFGLVGAYAIPFLLSNNSGNVLALFTYISIINLGVLFLSLYKNWRPIYYSAFGLSWIMYSGWYVTLKIPEENFALAFTFLSIFFITFYITFLAYKIRQKEKFLIQDIIVLIINSSIFYGIGYSLLNQVKSYQELLGLYTLLNAIIHFAVSYIVNKQKLADKNLFYFIIALVLLFVTIAIPVQLDGNWVTLSWTVQSTLLFIFGRTKAIKIYEKLSYPLIALAFFSIVQDWIFLYDTYDLDSPDRIKTIFNINFLSSLIVSAGFGVITYLNNKHKVAIKNKMQSIFEYAMPALFIVTLYFSVRVEIAYYWNQLRFDTAVSIPKTDNNYSYLVYNESLYHFKMIWLYCYTFIFVTSLSALNTFKIKNNSLGIGSTILIAITAVLFIFNGLFDLGFLRDNYISQHQSEYFVIGFYNIAIRYICFIFLAIAIKMAVIYKNTNTFLSKYQIAYDISIHAVILTLLSNELITWLSIYESEIAYKTTLSILWGIYALYLIVFGILKKKQHLRIGAISLLGVTLLKLFFYDLRHLNTIQKTIVFVSLGVLILLISFLYNKFKTTISDEK